MEWVSGWNPTFNSLLQVFILYGFTENGVCPLNFSGERNEEVNDRCFAFDLDRML
jgi:hypothetical protein